MYINSSILPVADWIFNWYCILKALSKSGSSRWHENDMNWGTAGKTTLPNPQLIEVFTTVKPMPGPEMGKFFHDFVENGSIEKVISHVSIAFILGRVWMGFSAACQNQSQEPTLFSILICRVISAKSMWCGGHVWHLAVRVGVIADHAICMSICRFVGSSRSCPLIMVIANDWLPPRQKSLPHDSAWVLVDIHCLCIFGWPASRVEIHFFWERWNPSTIKSWCWGFSFLKIKVAVLALLDFPRFVREILKKTDLEGKDLPLIFGQSLVGHSLYCQNHDSPNVQTWCEEMSPQILRVSECLSLALHWKLLLELAPEHGQLFL